MSHFSMPAPSRARSVVLITFETLHGGAPLGREREHQVGYLRSLKMNPVTPTFADMGNVTITRCADQFRLPQTQRRLRSARANGVSRHAKQSRGTFRARRKTASAPARRLRLGLALKRDAIACIMCFAADSTLNLYWQAHANSPGPRHQYPQTAGSTGSVAGYSGRTCPA